MTTASDTCLVRRVAALTGAMRGAFIYLALLVMPAVLVTDSLALAPDAVAAPAVTLRVTPFPIPGFPGTGNLLGAGAEVEVQSTISGVEYGGFPSPLVGLIFDAPAGTRITTDGFATCAPTTLEARGPGGCPKRSIAGPRGEGLGVVSFGGEQVKEKVSIQGFFAPNDGLVFFVDGSTPVSLQIVEKASWVSAKAPFGPRLIVEVPLVETVPGANDASILSFKVAVGAAYKRGKRTVSYITLPKKCTRNRLSTSSELKFESGESTTVASSEPCPRR